MSTENSASTGPSKPEAKLSSSEKESANRTEELRKKWDALCKQLLREMPIPKQADKTIKAIRTKVIIPYMNEKILDTEARKIWEMLFQEMSNERKAAADSGSAATKDLLPRKPDKEPAPEQRSGDVSEKAPEKPLSTPPAIDKESAFAPQKQGELKNKREETGDKKGTEVAKSSPEGPEEPSRQDPEPITAKWEEREPEDQTDPVEHHIKNCEPFLDDWNIIAASVRGKLHAHRGIWREDAYGYGSEGNWAILVVSDGAGSAKFSRIAARLACESAIAATKEVLGGYKLDAQGKDDKPLDSDLKRLRSFLARAALKAQESILREAQNRACSPKDLYATLLLVIHTPWKDREVLGVVQIGDGAIGVLADDDTCTVMGISDHGEYSSETRFLTTPHIEREFEERVKFTVRKNIRALAIMCDGVADDFFPEEKHLIELFLGNPIRALKQKNGDPLYGLMRKECNVLQDPRGGEALIEWLQYEKRGSSDDRSLLLMYRRDLL